ncbi:MAG: hypothetical protein ACXIUO_12520 [Erythrobacter sp.]
MTFLEDIHACALRTRIEEMSIDPSNLIYARSALIAGWDYIPDRRKVVPPTNGVWRTPHFDPSTFFSDSETVPAGIVTSATTVPEIETDFWRLLMIFPDPVDHRYEVTSDGKIQKSDLTKGHEDAFKPISFQDGGSQRDQYIREIIGHSVHDIANFCQFILQQHPEVGKLIMAKRFREALASLPELETMDWHKRAIRARARVRPFFACVLLAELQRLAQNVCAHIRLSYFPDGRQVSIATFKTECNKFQKKENQRCKAEKIYAPCISKTIAWAMFQTRLHQFTITKDRDAAVDAVNRTTKYLFNEIVKGGEPLIDHVSGISHRSPAPELAKSAAAHVSLLPGKVERGGYKRHHRASASTYWGKDWFMHAAIGLCQIRDAAEVWSRQHYPKRSWKSSSECYGGLRCYIARIPFFWLETINPLAFLDEALVIRKQKMRSPGRRSKPTHQSKAKLKRPSVDCRVGMPLPEICEEFDRDAFSDIQELIAIFDDPDTRIKEKQVEEARKEGGKFPKRGMPGYSAQYRPHLWLDNENDDIGFWIARENEHRIGNYFKTRPGGASLTASKRSSMLLAQTEHFGKHKPSLEAKVCQNLAMIIGPFAADPIHMLPEFSV